jgi:predicted NBD/HSP70 family sugar kinase
VCGRRGCWAESIRPQRLVIEGLRAGVLSLPDGSRLVDGGDAELDVEVVDALFTRLTEAAEAGDERAAALIDRSIRNTAFYLTNLAALLDLDRVVFGGPSWSRIERRYLAQLPDRLAELDTGILTHPVLVEGSAVGDDVAAVGAACLVLNETFSPRVGRG